MSNGLRPALTRNIGDPKSKNLVFTSAGDNANLNGWLKGYCNFDLWVSYYGEVKGRYRGISDFYIARKGGKFPNLQYAYQQWGEIFNHYQAVFVMDDDILISGSDISRLFEIREQYDLWLLQPAFDPRGKISYQITEVRPLSFLRYTNFVEVTCPLFRKDKLNDFLKVYVSDLVGWGIDWWYLDLLASDKGRKVAIIDEISCLNPHDRTKGGQREIDLLQDTPTRIENWMRIKEQHKIRQQEPMQFEVIEKKPNFPNIIDAISIFAIRIWCNCVRTIKKWTGHFT